MIIPIYQAELAHRKIRGRITSLQQLFNATGQVFATWIGTYCLAVGLKSAGSLTHLTQGTAATWPFRSQETVENGASLWPSKSFPQYS